MRTTFALIITLLPFCLNAQQTALFETTLWFTDAMGNTDSVVVGYDPDAKWDTLNPQFGEVLIDTPFDSVFEVRASFDYGWTPEPQKQFTKKKISRAEKEFWVSEPCFDIWPLGIHIYARHYPVTVKWNMDDFRTQCRTLTFLASHNTSIHIQNWQELQNIMDYTQCMSADSIYTVTGTEDTWEWYIRYPTTLTNDSSDLTSVLHLRLLDKTWLDVPCPIVVSVDQIPTGQALQLFPNPASSSARIAISEGNTFTEDLQIRLYNTGLQEVGHYNWPASSGYFDIPLSKVPSGQYFVEVKDQRGLLVNIQKLVVE